jgi:hypothetical protein
MAQDGSDSGGDGGPAPGAAHDLDTIRRRDGVLLRWSDGTLYFVPKAVLDEHRIDTIPEGIAGRQEGDDLQKVMDRMPPIFRLKNAIRTLGDAFDDLLDSGDPGGAFKPKTESLAEVAAKFPASRSYRAWTGFAKSDEV